MCTFLCTLHICNIFGDFKNIFNSNRRTTKTHINTCECTTHYIFGCQTCWAIEWLEWNRVRIISVRTRQGRSWYYCSKDGLADKKFPSRWRLCHTATFDDQSKSFHWLIDYTAGMKRSVKGDRLTALTHRMMGCSNGIWTRAIDTSSFGHAAPVGRWSVSKNNSTIIDNKKSSLNDPLDHSSRRDR